MSSHGSRECVEGLAGSTAEGTQRVFVPCHASRESCLRPTRAEISLAGLRHNLAALRREAKVPVWAVLKADAYGHGSKVVGRVLEDAGVSGVCVALVEEGIELREAGVRVPILVMGAPFGPAWGEVLRYRLTPVLSGLEQVTSLGRAARARGARVAVHLEFDTGMARLGFPVLELEQLASSLSHWGELKPVAAMTHLASAGSDPELVSRQLERFDEAWKRLKSLGVAVGMRHAANTAGALCHQQARFDLVRPGIGLFGLAPGAPTAAKLVPVMRVRTEIVALRTLPPGAGVGYGSTWRTTRTSRIATLPIGYADGISRARSNRGQVLVRGRRVPLVGTVSMDLTTIDVSDAPGVALGDEVVVLGSQSGPLGGSIVRADEIAEESGTVAWEVLTSVSRRVPRFYSEE